MAPGRFDESDADLFVRRYSCRAFRSDPVPLATLEALLEAAIWAPTAGGLEPWRFVVIQAGEARRAMAAAALGQRFLAEAPVVIVVCALPEISARLYGDRGRHLYCIQDVAAATQNLLLAAAARGLGSCWVGAFDEAAVARLADLPEDWRPVALVAIGWASRGAPRRARQPWSAVTMWIDE